MTTIDELNVWLERIAAEELADIRAMWAMHGLVGDDGDPEWGWDVW